MLHVEEKECAKTNERAQHTMWCHTGLAAGDTGEVSRGKAGKAVLGHAEEAGQQWGATGVNQAEHWGNYSGCIWGMSWAGGMLLMSRQEPTAA